MSGPLLFDEADLPHVAVPVGEASQEWRDAQLLRLVEAIRFDPERLARYCENEPSRRDFLDHVIWQLGGRSQ